MTQIYIVRHGQTIFNQLNKLQGWCDSPLTEQGIADAHTVGHLLAKVHFDQIISSDTTRAENTAKIIRKQNETSGSVIIQPQKSFREAFFGYFEGLDNDSSWRCIAGPHHLKNQIDILKQYNITTARDWMKAADPYHRAENGQEFWNRVLSGLVPFENTSNQNILIVSHGTLIRSLVMRFAPEIDTFSNYPSNGSYTILSYGHQTWNVEKYNISNK